jgi:hypothetical protein
VVFSSTPILPDDGPEGHYTGVVARAHVDGATVEAHMIYDYGSFAGAPFRTWSHTTCCRRLLNREVTWSVELREHDGRVTFEWSWVPCEGRS